MRQTARALILCGIAAAAGSVLAAGAVNVNFVNATAFSDTGVNTWDKQANLDTIAKHLQSRAALPGWRPSAEGRCARCRSGRREPNFTPPRQRIANRQRRRRLAADDAALLARSERSRAAKRRGNHQRHGLFASRCEVRIV